MPKPILVGYDPKLRDMGPVEFGLTAARFTGAPLIISSVYHGSVVVGQMGHGQMDEEIGGDANTALDHLRRTLQTGRVHTEFWPVSGRSAPAALHDAIESFGAGMLVVGSTSGGHGGVVRPGSTAERLMHGAPCPIAVVPHGWTPGDGLKTLGVGYADTPESREAVKSALALARRAGAKLRVLAAVKPKDFGRSAGGRPGSEKTSFDSVGEHEAEATKDALKVIGDAGGVEIEIDVSAQDAADFLAAASGNVELLIVGSRGYGPRKAVLLGGVSRKVVREAKCPVIVLARGTDSQLEALIGAAEAATA